MRKYFGTDGIRGLVGIYPITPDFILKLGWAVGKVLAETSHTHVIIGKDTRISGYMFESALEAGLVASGTDVYQLGPMPTPGVAYLTRTLRAQAGIVISASHNPYQDNGIKFFASDGYKLKDEIEMAIEEYLEKPLTTVQSISLGKARRIVDAPARYIEFCKSAFGEGKDLKGIKIVVDCANGAGYSIAPNVLRELGADVVVIGASPNGININEQCGSTHPDILIKTVKETHADLGIALDGDGDRLIMVDHLGEILDGDEILFILTMAYAEQNKLKGGVVGTQMTNLGLEEALNQRSIPFIRTKVGDRYIIEELLKKGWNLGGEASGHLICLDKTTTGDGIIAALGVLAEICHKEQSLHSLKKGMHKYSQVLHNVTVTNGHQVVASEAVQNALRKALSHLKEKGRIVLRPSGTEPVIRVMVEGIDAALINTIALDIAEVVQQHAEP